MSSFVVNYYDLRPAYVCSDGVWRYDKQDRWVFMRETESEKVREMWSRDKKVSFVGQ